MIREEYIERKHLRICTAQHVVSSRVIAQHSAKHARMRQASNAGTRLHSVQNEDPDCTLLENGGKLSDRRREILRTLKVGCPLLSCQARNLYTNSEHRDSHLFILLQFILPQLIDVFTQQVLNLHTPTARVLARNLEHRESRTASSGGRIWWCTP